MQRKGKREGGPWGVYRADVRRIESDEAENRRRIVAARVKAAKDYVDTEVQKVSDWGGYYS
jgi:hypothetical protein